MLRDRIVIGINNNNTRERLLREKDLDLDKAINLCRTSETAAIKLHSMEPTDTVDYARSRVSKPTSFSGQRAQITDCKCCGDRHSAGNCKAYGKTCSKCIKRNHFTKVCISRPQESHQHSTKRKTGKEKQDVHHLENNRGDGDIPEDLSSDESLYVVNSIQGKRKYFSDVLVESGDAEATTIKYQLDTGATCSTLTLSDYQKLTLKKPEQSQIELKLYDKTVIKPVGQVRVQCTANGVTRKVHFQIVEDAPILLLSG